LKKINRTVLSLTALVLIMISASFAAVPMYDWFCRVTGYGGTPLKSNIISENVLEQKLKVRFDASISNNLAWEFKPLQHQIDVKIGETALVFYEAFNPNNFPVSGTASFNVVPYSVGNYFTKIDCFCFNEQTLNPGERVQMPVTFYIDPEIINDREAKLVNSITLSYTFYKIDEKKLDTVSTYPKKDTKIN
tara:strand:+ start:45 stop:617 length:573 start_codon:yes stop_codon:yes gene_type:complete